MEICLSVLPQSMKEAKRLLAGHPGLLELRIDAIRDLDLEHLLAVRTRRLIVTNRTADDGGAFRGTEAEQFELLAAAVRLGAAYVDVEWRWGRRFLDRLEALGSGSRFILSHHDFRRTPDLLPLYARMRAARPDVVKIAAMAADISDSARMFALWRRARRDRQPMIGICMGERGEITRILGGRGGCLLTYGAPDSGTPTGPGQRSAGDLQNVFRVHTLDRNTRVFGLIGNPVSHSRGVYYHNAVFRRRRLNAVYVNFLVDQIPSFFRTVAAECSGFSVTMPHKQAIIRVLDSVDDAARALGAVNTVVRRRGGWRGSNTDEPALSHLLGAAGGVRGRRILVLGTGGMARTMVYAALRAGASAVTVAGRTPAKAKALAGRMGCDWIRFTDAETVACDVVMNATPVGMDGRSSPCSASFLRRCRLVVDAVYTPGRTPLLRRAAAAGCRTVGGPDIFRGQAALQSRIFIDACL